MEETIAEYSPKIVAAIDGMHIPVDASVMFILGVVGFFVYLFYLGHKNPKSNMDWEDLFLDTKTKKANPYKVGYIVGVFISTWIVVNQSAMGILGVEFFSIYLLFLLGAAGFKSFLSKKYDK